MSLYQQPHMYSQPSYPSVGYASRPPVLYQQPQPHQQHYSAAPPPPSHPVPTPVYRYGDPNAFRRDYVARLAQLTENSRPIIQSLSMMAQDYSRWADIVGESIEAHIRQVPPWMKLPAFYLLDSISKNVFDPYARTFTPFVAPLFLESYGLVDAPTRSKMEEMLLTWRTGGLNGKELFGVSSQVAIERGIWGNVDNSRDGLRQASGQQGHITKGQVLSELDFTFGAKQRALQVNPHDITMQHQCMVLQQLRSLVESGVSQEELRQILAQLRTMAPPPQSVPSQPRHAPPPQQPTLPIIPPIPPMPPVASTSALPPFPPPFPPPAAIAPVVASAPIPAPTAMNPPMAALPDANALQGLFSALLKAGVVSSDASSSTSTPNSGVQLARLEDIKPQEEVDQSRLAAREYRRRLLAHPINLNANDITRQRPVIVEMQYERQRLQCNQCGLRFIDNVAGKKDLEDHLDVHFKQNRKAAQNAGRGHGRSWFIGIEDWIHDTADVKGKGRADGGRRLTVKEAAAEEVAKRDAELRAMHVVITDGDETKPIKCLICKEPIVPQFLEDVEEWVWQNAIKKDDKVFHATCHAEAMSSTNSLVSRIRNEATGSRSTTPSSLRATPPKTIGSPSAAGTKRKADGDVKHEEGTPPSKKVALAA